MTTTLWIRDTGGVWHHAARRATALTYGAACGSELTLRHAAVWPQKASEAGPDQADRCRTCVGDAAAAFEAAASGFHHTS